MLVAIFLLCLMGFVAAVWSLEWLFAAMSGLSDVTSAQFFVALGGMGAITVLIRYGLGGLVLTVVLAVFWSILLLGAEAHTVTATLMIAALVLYAAAAATVVEVHLDDGA